MPRLHSAAVLDLEGLEKSGEGALEDKIDFVDAPPMRNFPRTPVLNGVSGSDNIGTQLTGENSRVYF